MKNINLKDFYPYYQDDCYITVEDDVYDALMQLKRAEHAASEKIRYHKANLEFNSYTETLLKSESLEESYIQVEQTLRLKQAINKLTIKQKTYINQYYFEGMTMEQIAQRHRIGKAGVSITIKRALKNLKKRFAE